MAQIEPPAFEADPRAVPSHHIMAASSCVCHEGCPEECPSGRHECVCEQTDPKRCRYEVASHHIIMVASSCVCRERCPEECPSGRHECVCKQTDPKRCRYKESYSPGGFIFGHDCSCWISGPKSRRCISNLHTCVCGNAREIECRDGRVRTFGPYDPKDCLFAVDPYHVHECACTSAGSPKRCGSTSRNHKCVCVSNRDLRRECRQCNLEAKVMLPTGENGR